MGLTCAILQPSYLPWRGYFHIIQRADVFVFYDDVQYDHGGWRNRNRISTAQGPRWITVPVRHRGHLHDQTQLRDVEIVRPNPWARRHLAAIQQSYGRAPHFAHYFDVLTASLGAGHERLAELTITSTIALARELGLNPRFERSSELGIVGGQTERLVSIAHAVGADRYISGPAARNYIDPHCFAEAGVGLEYMDYRYPEYPQLRAPFEPQLSIVDLLFMCGPEAPRYIWAAPGP